MPDDQVIATVVELLGGALVSAGRAVPTAMLPGENVRTEALRGKDIVRGGGEPDLVTQGLGASGRRPVVLRCVKEQLVRGHVYRSFGLPASGVRRSDG